MDALLEEGMPVPKKMRVAEDRYGGESDHQSDGEGGVQPMMTKIKTVLKSEWSGTIQQFVSLVLCLNMICGPKRSVPAINPTVFNSSDEPFCTVQSSDNYTHNDLTC